MGVSAFVANGDRNLRHVLEKKCNTCRIRATLAVMDNQPNDVSPLRVALDDAGLGVKTVARHMGYARSTVHRWVTGDNDPRWSSFRHLRNVLALDESELFALYSQQLAWSRRRSAEIAKATR